MNIPNAYKKKMPGLDGGGPAGHKERFRNGVRYWVRTSDAIARGVPHHKAGKSPKKGSAKKSSAKKSSSKKRSSTKRSAKKGSSPGRKLSINSIISNRADVIKVLPAFKRYLNSADVNEDTRARRLYGNHAKPLTPRIIKGTSMAVGQQFYGLAGRGWWDPVDAATREAGILTLQFDGFTAGSGAPVKPDYADGDSVVFTTVPGDGRVHVAVECGGSRRATFGTGGTGAACEELYIFLK